MKKIAIIPNDTKDKELENTRQITEFLKDRAEIYLDEKYRSFNLNAEYVAEKNIYDTADYVIVLGGDGTILRSAADCAKRQIPILGINLGKIGFMTEIETDKMQEALERFINDDYIIEKRMMIKAQIKRENQVLNTFYALNDVVVSKPVGEKLICIELLTDGEAVNRYIADGLIIATPTGSTGYSISAGGPVVDPCMRLYVATPICAHMLSVRSAVLSSDKAMNIKLDDSYGIQEAVVSADGDVRGYIKPGDEICITESEYDFKLIKIGVQSFYDTVLKKLS